MSKLAVCLRGIAICYYKRGGPEDAETVPELLQLFGDLDVELHAAKHAGIDASLAKFRTMFTVLTPGAAKWSACVDNFKQNLHNTVEQLQMGDGGDDFLKVVDNLAASHHALMRFSLY